ncbi:MAG: ABC transporter ATP-binding protein [Gemmatimonadaceae bacterium]
MPDVAIRCEALGKRYRVGHREPYRTLRDSISDMAASPFRRRAAGRGHPGTAPLETENERVFWALRNVSFEINRGEIVGVIGRNGAGKSTLLKILSRITTPTTGHAAITGRVGSLLEVGTGFHPELTGRENIFLNAAILGMRRAEVVRKFDEIVSFAEVERFIDTPVKRYSSGMYMRLAFAVAAHLEPEIMVIDEVLAVGDAVFQKKCLGKIGEVAEGGRTVLFVSHNMQAVRSLCDQGIWLDEGTVRARGEILEVTRKYEALTSISGDTVWVARDTDLDKQLVISRVAAHVAGQQPSLRLEVQVDLLSRGSHKPAFLAIDVLDALGHSIMQALPELGGFIDSRSPGHHVEVSIELPPLVPSSYSLTVWIGSHNTVTLDEARSCVTFEISESPTPGRTFPHSADHGFVVPVASLKYRAHSNA